MYIGSRRKISDNFLPVPFPAGGDPVFLID